jgi:hypothetical protein
MCCKNQSLFSHSFRICHFVIWLLRVCHIMLKHMTHNHITQFLNLVAVVVVVVVHSNSGMRDVPYQVLPPPRLLLLLLAFHRLSLEYQCRALVMGHRTRELRMVVLVVVAVVLESHLQQIGVEEPQGQQEVRAVEVHQWGKAAARLGSSTLRSGWWLYEAPPPGNIP